MAQVVEQLPSKYKALKSQVQPLVPPKYKNKIRSEKKLQQGRAGLSKGSGSGF
jgi:hypothetical protein